MVDAKGAKNAVCKQFTQQETRQTQQQVRRRAAAGGDVLG
jgi:hypothetical protein